MGDLDEAGRESISRAVRRQAPDILVAMLLRDPVHGLISLAPRADGLVDAPLSRLLVTLVDTPEVQRLRRIKALGLASLVYPGGEHSRFAHALGATHVMMLWLEHLRRLETDLPSDQHIDRFDVATALCAALLHDVGHGPYSHTFEELFADAPAHETWTSRLLLDASTAIHRALAEFDPSLPGAVDDLVFGRSRHAHLAASVCGTFDVDRCDYLLRDSHMTGVRYGTLDLPWLLASLRLRDRGDGSLQWAVDGDKGLTAVEGFFLARLYMYRQVYFHKAARAAERVMRAMFARLVEIGPVEGTPSALAAAARGERLDVARYLELDDATLEAAMFTWQRGADPVMAELARRLHTRRLFKTTPLPIDVDDARVELALRGWVADAGSRPEHACVERLSVADTLPSDALVVLHPDGRSEPLVRASPLLAGLAQRPFVSVRAIYPPECRDAVEAGLRRFLAQA